MKNIVKRGNYGEINTIATFGLNSVYHKQIKNLVNAAANAAKVDEHGSWDFGSDFDRKGRGSALNWDLYGYGRDTHSRRLLIVIQIRQFVRRSKNYFANIKKSYFLIGRNEDNTVFAHSVPSRTIHHAINNGKDVVKACQDWIFGCDYAKVIRQGDIALIPAKKVSGEKISKTDVLIENSHRLTADAIAVNGSVYAQNPSMLHIPGTHPTISGEGWYKVVVGNRASFHDFAAPTID
jgi:hypothetical protein